MKSAIFCNNLNVVSVRSKLRGKLGITKISEKEKNQRKSNKGINKPDNQKATLDRHAHSSQIHHAI